MLNILEQLGTIKTVFVDRSITVYLEVHCTYNLLSSCSYNPVISRVTIIMELIFRL